MRPREPTQSTTYVAVLEELVHVDALRVQQALLLPRAARGLVQQAARDAGRLHDDGAVGQRGQQRRQVKVHVGQREGDGHLRDGGRKQ